MTPAIRPMHQFVETVRNFPNRNLLNDLNNFARDQWRNLVDDEDKRDVADAIFRKARQDMTRVRRQPWYDEVAKYASREPAP